MAEGEPMDRPDDGKIAKSNAVTNENGLEIEPDFSDEEGFVDKVSDEGELELRV